MIVKSLQTYLSFKKTVNVFIFNGIHTDSLLFARVRGRRAGKLVIESKDEVNSNSPDIHGVTESFDFDEEIDVENVDNFYKQKSRKVMRNFLETQKKIVAKKFFTPAVQPLMLTCDEKLAIQNLHKEDPVQWSIKALSESFPATPGVIKKILKRRYNNVTLETKQKLDSIVQKNWELLAEDKLDADPSVLKHLKQFINRREVLLEQVKNAKFYLPEVKDKPVLNNGDMCSILNSYEEAINKLVKSQKNKTAKAISDGASNIKGESENEENNLNIVQQKVKSVTKKFQEPVESFKLKTLVEAYKEESTFDDFEKYILKKAESRRKMDYLEKAVLESTLKKTDSPSHQNEEEKTFYSVKEEASLKSKNAIKNKYRLKSGRKNMEEQESFDLSKSEKDNEELKDPVILPDDKTKFVEETDVGKVFVQTENTFDLNDKKMKLEEKQKDYFSNPLNAEKDKLLYDREVNDIKNTSFWNSGTTSKDKRAIELMKESDDVPATNIKVHGVAKNPVFSTDTYPQKIKIPKHQQGTGLTFRIKDCYYDDDGEFLYRVPGMTKTA